MTYFGKTCSEPLLQYPSASVVRFWLRPPARLQTPNFWMCPHWVEGARELCGASFITTIASFEKVAPSGPNHLTMAPPPNTVSLGIRIPTCESGRDKNIQAIALPCVGTTDCAFASCKTLMERSGSPESFSLHSWHMVWTNPCSLNRSRTPIPHAVLLNPPCWDLKGLCLKPAFLPSLLFTS